MSWILAKRLPFLLIVWLAASATTHARADVDSGAGSDEKAAVPAHRELETIRVTATRAERSLADVSEAITVISHRAINRDAPNVLAEMLRGVPGASFQQTTPGQGVPIIRGLKGSQLLHLVDGIRLNNAFFRSAPNQYLGLVDSYAVGRIEVLRGSAPSLYGADAMGGVVSILMAEPEFEGAQWQTRGRLYGSFDNASNSVVGRVQAALGKTGSAFSGGVTYQDHSNRKTGGGETIASSGYRVKAADVKWRQALGVRSEIMLSAQYLRQPSTPRVDELVPGFGQDHPSSDQYEFRPNQRSLLQARYGLKSDSPWFSRFEANLARQVIIDDRLTQDYLDPEFTLENNKSVLDGLTLQINSPWGAGGQQELIWGFEYYSDEISSSRIRTDSSGRQGLQVRGRFPDRSEMDSAAVYASNRWQLGRLTLNAGLRYSWFSIRLPATSQTAAVELKPDDLTGDIRLNYELTPRLRVVSNIGRGFRPPNVFDLGALGSRPGNRLNIPNPGLKPESVWSYDLGLKSRNSRWQSELFVFYSDYRDKISSRSIGETTPEGRSIVRSDNLNSVKLWGIESGLRYLWSDEWESYAVLNYTHGEEKDFSGAEEAADRIPPLNGRLGLIYRNGAGLRLEPYVDFAGKQDRLSARDIGDPRIDPRGTPSWFAFNLLLGWQAREWLELGLRVNNLADKKYREHGSGIDAPGRNIGFWVDVAF